MDKVKPVPPKSRTAKSRPPKPGQPSRKTKSGRAVMALIDLIGRRWVLRILWELRGDPLTFRALQQACDNVSPSVLNQRLAELRETALVEAGEEGYCLSELGRQLSTHILPLMTWAEKWADALS